MSEISKLRMKILDICRERFGYDNEQKMFCSLLWSFWISGSTCILKSTSKYRSHHLILLLTDGETPVDMTNFANEQQKKNGFKHLCICKFVALFVNIQM